MADKVYLKEWTKYVNADNFSRAFGCIVSGEKENIFIDFAVAGE